MTKRSSSILLITVCLLFVFAVTTAPAAASDKWTKVQSKNFTLIGNGNEKDIRKVATKLEQFRHVITLLLPNVKFTTPVPTTVVVFKDDNSFKPFKTGNVAGYFQPGNDVNYIALSDETEGEQTPYTIIFHEYVHLMINNSIDDDVPVWYNEGLAEYYSTFAIKDDIKVTIGNLINTHLYVLNKYNLLPLKTFFTVDRKSPYYNERNKQSIFYAQCWLLMHYLIQNHGGSRVNYIGQFLTNLSKGIEMEKAFSEAFKMPLAQLEKELQEYATKLMFPNHVWTFKEKLLFDKEMIINQLTEADSQAYLGDLLAHMRNPSAEAYLQKALRLNPNHMMAQTSLGMLYARQKRFSEAKNFLEKAIAANTQNHLAHFYYAQSATLEKQQEGNRVSFTPDELKSMRASLKKAIELSPTFPESYRLLAYINLVAQEQIDESIDLLKRARSYSPGRRELDFMLAQCYLAKRDFKLVRELAEPLARSSSNEELKSRAQSLLNYIKNIEERKIEFEIWGKKQEKEANGTQNANVDTTSGIGDGEGIGLRVGLYKPGKDEKQIRGELIRIDCLLGNKGVFIIKVGEKLYNLYKENMSNVRFVTFTSKPPFEGQLTCGAVKNPVEVIATFRDLKDKTLKYDGEVFIMEFIPKDFKQARALNFKKAISF